MLTPVTTISFVFLPQVLEIGLKLNMLYSSTEPLQQLRQLLTPAEQIPKYLVTLIPAALSLPPSDHPKHTLALFQAAAAVASACGLQEGCSRQALLLLQALLGPGASLSLQEGLHFEEELFVADDVTMNPAAAACNKLPFARVASEDQDKRASQGSHKEGGMLSAGIVAGGESPVVDPAAGARRSGARTADGKAGAGAKRFAGLCQEEDEGLVLMGVTIEERAEEGRQQQQPQGASSHHQQQYKGVLQQQQRELQQQQQL